MQNLLFHNFLKELIEVKRMPQSGIAKSILHSKDFQILDFFSSPSVSKSIEIIKNKIESKRDKRKNNNEENKNNNNDVADSTK